MPECVLTAAHALGDAVNSGRNVVGAPLHQGKEENQPLARAGGPERGPVTAFRFGLDLGVQWRVSCQPFPLSRVEPFDPERRSEENGRVGQEDQLGQSCLASAGRS